MIAISTHGNQAFDDKDSNWKLRQILGFRPETEALVLGLTGLDYVSLAGELYGLTPTEAKVAREFARGHSYKQVAQRLRISEDTVRAHIKQIYPKTRVNRQSDLVRLILSMSTSGV